MHGGALQAGLAVLIVHVIDADFAVGRRRLACAWTPGSSRAADSIDAAIDEEAAGDAADGAALACDVLGLVMTRSLSFNCSRSRRHRRRRRRTPPRGWCRYGRHYAFAAHCRRRSFRAAPACPFPTAAPCRCRRSRTAPRSTQPYAARRAQLCLVKSESRRSFRGSQRGDDFRFQFDPVGLAETGVLGQHLAVRPDQHAARHTLDAVAARRGALRVVGDGELRRRAGQELRRVGAAGVEVDADDLQTARAVLGLHLVHPRERLAARAAPRRPEIDVHHLAAILRQLHRPLRPWQLESRRGLAPAQRVRGAGGQGGPCQQGRTHARRAPHRLAHAGCGAAAVYYRCVHACSLSNSLLRLAVRRRQPITSSDSATSSTSTGSLPPRAAEHPPPPWLLGCAEDAPPVLAAPPVPLRAMVQLAVPSDWSTTLPLAPPALAGV